MTARHAMALPTMSVPRAHLAAGPAQYRALRQPPTRMPAVRRRLSHATRIALTFAASSLDLPIAAAARLHIDPRIRRSPPHAADRHSVHVRGGRLLRVP